MRQVMEQPVVPAVNCRYNLYRTPNGRLENWLKHVILIRNTLLNDSLQSTILKFIIICDRDRRLEIFSFIFSWKSKNFDGWTTSVVQVVPEIPPPPSTFSHWICTDLTDHLSEPSKWRNSANWRKIWSPDNAFCQRSQTVKSLYISMNAVLEPTLLIHTSLVAESLIFQFTYDLP